jgi:hypothetical protein
MLKWLANTRQPAADLRKWEAEIVRTPAASNSRKATKKANTTGNASA